MPTLVASVRSTLERYSSMKLKFLGNVPMTRAFQLRVRVLTIKCLTGRAPGVPRRSWSFLVWLMRAAKQKALILV
jgi:hypothetical protein